MNYPTGIQIILTTHSPFILSDLPKENIIFLEKETDGNCKIVDALQEINQTFGANIHTLLTDSFFMDSLIGKFAKRKINNIITSLNKDMSLYTPKELDQFKRVIQKIGEPIIKRLLLDKIEKIVYQKESIELAELKDKITDLEEIDFLLQINTIYCFRYFVLRYFAQIR